MVQGLLTDAQTYAKQHPDHDGIALFQQRVAMASVIMSDVQRPQQILSAVKEIRRLFPVEVDPMEDMPILSVYMCSLRIRWSYFFLCALFTALALFAGTITELFFAVFAAGADISVCQQVWLSFWLLPFGAMFLALVGDEMGDLVIDAIDRPPLLWCLSLVLAAVQRDRRLAPARSTCEAVDMLIIGLSEVVPLCFGFRSLVQRRGFWHGYMQGGLIAAFLLTLVVLLADVTIGIYGSRAQQALRHVYHVLDKHKICPGTIAVRYELLRSHFEQASLQQNREQGCKRFATLLVFAWRRASRFMLESWSLCAFTQQNALMPVTLVAWTAVSALAVQDRFQFPVAVSAIMMVFTVTVLSVKMAMAFPDVAGPFYTVILIFFVCAALGLQVGGSFALGPKTVQPLMRMPGIFTGPTDLPHAWRGNRSEPPYAACRITWGSQEAPVSVLDLASLALIAYEVDCNAVPRLLEESFGSGMHAPRLESCRSYDELPRWISVRFPARRPGGGDTRVFAIKGTSSWRDVYADIKLFATIEVLQALSKIVPILSLLPVPLVQSIVGHTGLADTYMWDGLERAIDKDHRKSDVSVLTGHSLGGCIAQIVAGRRQLSALVFSSPGLLYSARRFDVSPESIRHVVAVVPDGDVISSVDEHAGVVQRIACRTLTGQAGSTAACHGLRKTACEVWRACGDVRGRDFSDTCVAYVLPDMLGHTLPEEPWGQSPSRDGWADPAGLTT
ncbi:Kidins220 [Symbiodinium microadriaticum]|nr:Kidins220 [Symbiodinium microadriaticum]